MVHYTNSVQKQITLSETTVTYTLRRSQRARRLRLAVRGDGSVVVTAPLYYPLRLAEEFIRQKQRWLMGKIASARQHQPIRRFSRGDYVRNKEAARQLVTERIDYYRGTYATAYNRISIRNQRTCWGSCSRKRNLNFNYKIVLLPRRLADYIIVHELCHLQEMNHSRKFWELVSRTFPDYQALRMSLRHYSLALN